MVMMKPTPTMAPDPAGALGIRSVGQHLSLRLGKTLYSPALVIAYFPKTHKHRLRFDGREKNFRLDEVEIEWLPKRVTSSVSSMELAVRRDAVGRRLEIYHRVRQKWYQGTILRYVEDCHQHVLQLEGAKVHLVDLNQQAWRFTDLLYTAPQSSTSSLATSKYRGVHRFTESTWKAYYAEDYIGCFGTEKDAALAYDVYARKRGTPVNFTDRRICRTTIQLLLVDEPFTPEATTSSNVVSEPSSPENKKHMIDMEEVVQRRISVDEEEEKVVEKGAVEDEDDDDGPERSKKAVAVEEDDDYVPVAPSKARKTGKKKRAKSPIHSAVSRKSKPTIISAAAPQVEDDDSEEEEEFDLKVDELEEPESSDDDDDESSCFISSDDEDEEEEEESDQEEEETRRSKKKKKSLENLFDSSDEEEEEDHRIARELKRKGTRALQELAAFNSPPNNNTDEPKKRKRSKQRKRPKYPIGTRFLKEFPGYGTFEGRVTEWDGSNYQVYYSEDEDQEEFGEKEMKHVEIVSIPGGGREALAAIRKSNKMRRTNR